MNLTRTICLLITSTFLCGYPTSIAETPSADWHDPSPHHREMVTVDQGVQLEVLDWGGSGPALVFLAGFANTAHIWDNFAPKFTDTYHVYAITRRGFGRSTHAPSGYTPERLSEDILAVINHLGLDKPVLVGHSFAGEELSYIGTHHADRIRALIYLDAAYDYAFYDQAGDYEASLKEINQKIEALVNRPEDITLIKQVQAALSQFEENLTRESNSLNHPLPPIVTPPSAADKASFAAMLKWADSVVGGALPEADLREMFLPGPNGSVGNSNRAPEAGSSSKSYEHFTTAIHLPILAIMSFPPSRGSNFKADTPERISAVSAADANLERQIDSFAKGQPTATVVRIANANHFIFISNESEVIAKMRKFLIGL